MSVEQTETRYLEYGNADEPVKLKSGGSLNGVRIAYETWGELNEAKDNAILIFHALSGSHRVTGQGGAPEVGAELWNESLDEGWWRELVGPGKSIDTDQYFVICPNYLGGCYGSTGPSDVNPETGKAYGHSFPQVNVADQADMGAKVIESLGIEKLHGLVGPSVGGLCALTFATNYAERVERVVLMASGFKTTVLNRLILFEQILAIENDPHFNGGDYYEGEKPDYGLALARMQGKKFVERFDANTYLRIVDMWSRYDAVKEGDAEDAKALLSRCAAAGQKFLIFSIDSDFCFYPEEQQEITRNLEAAEVPVTHITVHSDKGHDSFLIDHHLYGPHLKQMMED